MYTVYIEQNPKTIGALRHGEMRQTVNIAYFLHPKGQVAFLYDDYTFRQGLEKMKPHGYTATPVISRSGQYVGTVSEGDFLWKIFSEDVLNMRDLERIPLSEILRMDWNTPINITATFEDLLTRITEQNFVPVVDDRGVFIGIITRKDVIKESLKKPDSEIV